MSKSKPQVCPVINSLSRRSGGRAGVVAGQLLEVLLFVHHAIREGKGRDVDKLLYGDDNSPTRFAPAAIQQYNDIREHFPTIHHLISAETFNEAVAIEMVNFYYARPIGLYEDRRPRKTKMWRVNPDMSEERFAKLTSIFNSLHLIRETLSVKDFKAFLMGGLSCVVHVTKPSHRLGAFLWMLCEKNIIGAYWQHAFAKDKSVMSTKGKPMTRSFFGKAASDFHKDFDDETDADLKRVYDKL